MAVAVVRDTVGRRPVQLHVHPRAGVQTEGRLQTEPLQICAHHGQGRRKTSCSR